MLDGSTLQDFDNDGWPELLVTADYGVSRMFWNNQNGKFTECTQSCGLGAEQVHERIVCFTNLYTSTLEIKSQEHLRTTSN